ncbi:hypothetical protein FB550_12269 [Neobacillus bataviensis]|uniref:IstB-like ATP binding protein n=1 Tax=Neobacillus bataviensis TaxID=220685 RepID=A0A561CGI6_9BACI|nr:hypothetical protein [Neobacillus bataviensis]TWD90306.1 hypothetical protein FB550_12269 [Neobacillus bataviensis]
MLHRIKQPFDYGEPGHWKNPLCTAVARNLKANGFIVGLLTTGQILAKIKSTYNKGSSQTEEAIFRDLKKLDILILDDVGSNQGEMKVRATFSALEGPTPAKLLFLNSIFTTSSGRQICDI